MSPQYHWSWVANSINNPNPAEPLVAVFLAVGAGLTGLLALAQYRFAGWPLHPVGTGHRPDQHCLHRLVRNFLSLADQTIGPALRRYPTLPHPATLFHRPDLGHLRRRRRRVAGLCVLLLLRQPLCPNRDRHPLLQGAPSPRLLAASRTNPNCRANELVELALGMTIISFCKSHFKATWAWVLPCSAATCFRTSSRARSPWASGRCAVSTTLWAWQWRRSLSRLWRRWYST